jgi:hypothetical protein
MIAFMTDFNFYFKDKKLSLLYLNKEAKEYKFFKQALDLLDGEK